MSEYNSLKRFTEAVRDRMELKYEAKVSIDELLIDDLYRFMIVLPTEENWKVEDDEPSKLYRCVPSELDSVSVSEVVKLVDERSPEYGGESEYED